MIAFLISLLIRGYDNDTKNAIEGTLRYGRKPARRRLFKGVPADAGEPPDDDERQDLIHVVMTRGAAHRFRAALLRADGKLNPDFLHPEEDADAAHAEWLVWGYSRVEMAERHADAGYGRRE